MDILRVLSNSTLEVRRKTLDLALELMTPKLVEEVGISLILYIYMTLMPAIFLCSKLGSRLQSYDVYMQVVSVLKKEAVKTNTGATAGEQEDAARYRQLLVRALHQCAIRYPNVAASTIPLVRFIYCIIL